MIRTEIRTAIIEEHRKGVVPELIVLDVESYHELKASSKRFDDEYVPRHLKADAGKADSFRGIDIAVVDTTYKTVKVV